MTEENYASLRSNVKLLGRILGDSISSARGPEFLEKIELIRTLSKSARGGVAEDQAKLQDVLANLSPEELVPVSRAFSQFLNLANIADQHHTLSREMDEVFSATQTLSTLFDLLKSNDFSSDQILEAIASLNIELVLTAHPTEITRRTLIHKHAEIDFCLRQYELSGRTPRELDAINTRLEELVAQIWHTHDFREERPTPVDEAKWGYNVVEESLWQAVPDFLRRLDKTLFSACGTHLPVDVAPVTFASWMGGDRDGNPNVTATITEEVLLLARWQATTLYLKDVARLIDELSMSECNPALADLSGNVREPYRAVLREVRTKLRATLAYINARLAGQSADDTDVITADSELWNPFYACYQSLCDSGMSLIANSRLLDTLRRVKCFGVNLVKLDIRQESGRHMQVFSELTQHYELGDYAEWSEAEKLAFLKKELSSRRPLMPADWSPSADVKEVLDTCQVVARQPRGAIAAYVISMARQASDILAVQLLLKSAGCTHLPVAPLFETLDDLNRAPQVIEDLLQDKDYLQRIDNKLMIMIGYSDSAKDAGMLAAGWAQYRAQEELQGICDSYGVGLTLFHGRGGTIGRGGAPAHAALLSQPPGTLRGGLRVTEQGEMIRNKLGMSSVAVKTLALYASAVTQANLMGPPTPKPEWRELMDTMAESSCDAYRAYVRDEPRFVEYFRQATPELELANLPLGSRPARRKTGGGIASLRAIPWIFAWSQNRLMLPAWLGAGAALGQAIESGKQDMLQEMCKDWPFFETRLSMLEMVYAKSDVGLSAYYEEKLVVPELRFIGENLRNQLATDIETLKSLKGIAELLQDQAWSSQSIGLRNIYTDPLNVLQAELLRRNRAVQDKALERAIMVTIAGVAAGMRNTG